MSTVKYTKELLEKAVVNSRSMADVAKHLGIKYKSGNIRLYLKKRITDLGIDISHFDPYHHLKQRKSQNRLHPTEVFVYDRCKGSKEKTYILKRAMIESGIKYQCSECNLQDKWNNKPIVLQIDHINGDWLDNRKNNLRFLCPNCHSQTNTFGSKNKRI